MPPKSKLINRAKNKQKRTIEGKLMLLNFKVDDYIYNKIPIAVEEAQKFMDEINSYKKQCRNDIRSMQVIDKLTRLFTKIVEEQSAVSRTPCAQINSHNAGSDIIMENSITPVVVGDKSNDINTLMYNEIIPSNNAKDTDTQPNDASLKPSENNDINMNVFDYETRKNEVDLDSNSGIDNNNNEKNSSKAYPANTQGNVEVNADTSMPSSIESASSTQIEGLTCYEGHTKTFPDITTSAISKDEPKPTVVPTKSKPVSQKKKTKVVDLSWVENLNYVREITSDEYDPEFNNISHTFWENCTFPRDWDEEHFTF